MKELFKPGDKKIWYKQVEQADTAAFGGEQVHPVCSTFVLAREMEWASRLFVLEMCEADEEGIGTLLEVQHRSPALPGEELRIEAAVESLHGHELLCSIRVMVKDRLVATGRTGQKVLKKSTIENIFKRLEAQA